MTRAALDATIGIPEDVVFRNLEGEAIILNLATGIYFGLDTVGTRMWTLLAESASVQRVVDTICEEYDVEPDTAERDVLDLLNQLIEKGLVQLQASGGTRG